MAEATTADGMIIEYMDESSNGTHSELHTQATTVAALKAEKGLSASAVVAVDNVISNDGTALSPGCSVTVVSGNKTGGARRQTTISRPTTIPGGRGFDATLKSNGIAKRGDARYPTTTVDNHGVVVDTVVTNFRGKKVTFVIRDGVEMPARDMVSHRNSKYPFHLLEVGQSVTLPLTNRNVIMAAVRHFMDKNPPLRLEVRSLFEDGLISKPVLGIWRTV